MTASIGPESLPAAIKTDKDGKYYSIMFNGEEYICHFDDTPEDKYTAALALYDSIYGTK